MKNLSSVLSSLASLAWPAVVFYIFYVLQDDIKKLIGRLRKGKIFGQEIELDEEISQVENAVETVLEIIPNTQPTPNSAPDYREHVLAAADRSTLGTFLRVSSDLELLVNHILARTGWHQGRQKYTIKEGFARIPQNWVSKEILRTVQQFSHLRNRIIHESRMVPEEDVRRATEIAFSLIEVLKGYTIDENRVKDVVELYVDAEGQIPAVDVKGLRLETKRQGSAPSVSIFPTTKTWYKPGQLVSSEWNMSNVYNQHFYRDPEGDELKAAWLQSAEYVGEPLDELEF
jgi:hypothetical protein